MVLNGTSSSGKTSLAAALQRAAAELQLLHLQLDAFRAMEPPGYWSAEHRAQAPLRTEALCRAMNAATAQFVRSGQNVVVDHVLTPEACGLLLDDLGQHEVLFIKVGCSLAVLEAREALRGDRDPGLARSQLHSVHAACRYDYEIDTTSRTSAELAHGLAAWLRSHPRPAALAHMQRARGVA